MAHNSSVALAISAGAASLCAGVLIWKLSSDDKFDPGGDNLCDVAQSIDVDAVGGLLSSPDVKVAKSAELFLLNRASSPKHLKYFLKVCLSNDMDEVIKAVTVVHMLVQHSDEVKEKLISCKAAQVLQGVIKKISNNYDYSYLMEKVKHDPNAEKIFYCTIGSIFSLILRDKATTLQFCNEHMCIRYIFLPIIGDHGFHLSMDVKRWVLYMVHQLITCSDKNAAKQYIFQLGVVGKATECLIKTLGDLLQTHLCLQILIQYLSGTANDIKLVCKDMISLGITPHLVGLLRCEEDDNIVQLAAIIIHHFCCYDLEIKYLSSVPLMIKTLHTVLNNSNANIQKTIIRICNYLCVGSSQFHKSVIEHEPIIKRLSVCLSSGNPDVVYGTLMMLHDLIMPGKDYTYKIINKNPDILKALVKLAVTYNGEAMQLIPETLGFICSCEALHALILQHGVLDAILHFAKSTDVEVQFWASALLLNLSMISDEVKEAIIRSGGVHVLLEMAVSGDEVDLPDIATNATKTLVMMGFLSSTMDVRLVSGLEGSIIIDGTEHCPGKQGINLVVFDIINFQFHKGKVIDPAELVDFFGNPEFSISDSVFLVTQGDCSLSEEDGKIMEKYLKEGSGQLTAPSWCWIYMPNDTKLKYSEDNIQLNTHIQMKDLLGTVLEEHFTDPLIDVTLSMPPSSNVNKLDELGLIEILARHYHQRKAIVSTAGFLEYLFELIWSISSFQPHEYHIEGNKSKVSHCIAALKIVYSCSNDKLTLKELVHRGLLQPLGTLIQNLIIYCYCENEKTPIEKRNKNSIVHSYDLSLEKDATYCEVKDELDSKEFMMIEEEQADDEHDGSYLEYCVANLSDSDDNIFHSELSIGATADSIDATVVSDIEFETPQDNRANTTSTDSPSFRNRADSFIFRSDSQNRHNQDSLQRSLSVVGDSICAPREDATLYNPKSCISRGSVPQTPDHHQLRRISRSMSLSLQQAKYTEDYSYLQMKFSDETLNKIGRHVTMILHNVIMNLDEEIKLSFLKAHVLPFLYGYISCIGNGLHHERVWLAITSSLVHIASDGVDTKKREGVYIHHVDVPRSIIISSDGLEISNENWYFESVLANQVVSKQLYNKETNYPSGWYFEVLINTDGVMQIGWANKDCKFCPEKGSGVGDSLESVGFDGARCKIWNGPCRDMVQENEYGMEWQKGDVISVVLSWDGVLHYWINGRDLGATAVILDTELSWFPALSLAIGQHCALFFNKSSLRYHPPSGYVTITEVNTYHNKNISPVKVSVVDEFVPKTFDEVFRSELQVESDLGDSFFLFYYEIDMLQLASETEISLGFTLFSNRKTRTGDSNSELSSDSNAMDMIRTIPTVILENRNVKRLKNIGCGILSNLNFRITVDGTKAFEEPIKDIINKDVDMVNLFFDTVPYISHPHILVNFGQNDFICKEANLSRYKLFKKLCQLKET